MTNITANNYSVIGLMSGTSLDGVDIAFCKFSFVNNKWDYQIVEAETIKYSKTWRDRLLKLENVDALSFQKTNVDYGAYLGQLVSDFIIKNALKVQFVSSHGHTIFHQPENKLTVQIGSGAALAAKCNLPTVCDFRSLDIALGGQGAPLVPIGDQLLFSEYDFCLNLGGFANVSYQMETNRIAFDICPVNIVLNHICENLDAEYDKNGEFARQGMVSNYLLNELNQLGYYKALPNAPKSLGKEWVLQHIYPLLDTYELNEIDLLATFCEHIGYQIAKATNNKPPGTLLITGGGAYNTYLIERIQHHSHHRIVIPLKKTIEFKEALLFAFLGVLRMRTEINCLRSVTGAMKNNIGGAIYWNY